MKICPRDNQPCPFVKAKKQREKKDRPYWKELIAHIDQSWFKKKGVKFFWEARHFKQLGNLCRHFQPWGVMALWDLHLTISDDWAYKKGYSFECFLSRISKLIDEPLFKSRSKVYETKLAGEIPKDLSKVLVRTIKELENSK